MTLIMGLDKLVTLLLVKATTFDTGKTPSTLDNLFHTQAGSELGGLMYCPRSTEYTCHATWHSYAHVNPPCQLWHTSMDVRPLAGGEGKRQRVSAALSVVVTSFSLSLTCCVVSMWCCSGLTTWERTTDIKS